MTSSLLAVLAAAGIALLIDLVTTFLRKRTRRAITPEEPVPTEAESIDLTD
jgi:hypothetical protein